MRRFGDTPYVFFQTASVVWVGCVAQPRTRLSCLPAFQTAYQLRALLFRKRQVWAAK
ncbi:hypothetical protein [Kingella potus]|uniref:hypothetical protein n=1 Tax=Kingella potus TaxID=265175 RepID=UPI001FCFE3E3|nr:hypothetical protein [Kingella potus]UOP02036.1 hypothetical protein LVJ84_14385 [Kingella potus]